MTNYEYIQKCDPETLRDIIEKIAYCDMEPWSDQLGDLCEVCPTVVITDEVVQGKQLALKECDFSDGKCPHGDPIRWWLGQEQKGGTMGTEIKDSGERTVFSTGAKRDMHQGKGRMDLTPWAAIIRISQHCEQGALKYGEHNVDKGIVLHSLLDSGIRHLAKYMDGMDDEPHLVAAAWNILWAIQMELKHPELIDIPSREGKKTAAFEPVESEENR